MTNELKGFYKVWRRSRQHFMWNLKPYDQWHAWEYLISWAAFATEERFYQRQAFILERGQHVTTKNQLSHDWGWSWAKVDTFLKMLSRMSMVLEQTGRGCIILTLCNFNVWQGKVSRTGKQPTNLPGSDREATGNEIRRVRRGKKIKKGGARALGAPAIQNQPGGKDPKDFTPNEAKKALETSQLTKIPFTPELDAMLREKAKQAG